MSLLFSGSAVEHEKYMKTLITEMDKANIMGNGYATTSNKPAIANQKFTGVKPTLDLEGNSDVSVAKDLWAKPLVTLGEEQITDFLGNDVVTPGDPYNKIKLALKSAEYLTLAAFCDQLRYKLAEILPTVNGVVVSLDVTEVNGVVKVRAGWGVYATVQWDYCKSLLSGEKGLSIVSADFLERTLKEFTHNLDLIEECQKLEETNVSG
jgi:hypothetical protein